MKKIIIDLNLIRDDSFDMIYELFGLDVKDKSYHDFELRMIQYQIEIIVEFSNFKSNLTRCPKWIYTFESIQQKNDSFYCVWG